MVRPRIKIWHPFRCYVNTKPMTVISSFLPMRTRPFCAMFNSITSGIHFAVTLTLNLWQWSPHFSQWKWDLFQIPSNLQACWHLQKTSLSFQSDKDNSELVDIYKRQVSSFSLSRTTLSLLTFTKDKSHLSVRQGLPSNLLTFIKDKFHLLVRQGQLWTCWHLQKTSFTF